MKPILDQSFWSDPDIEAAAPKIKLTALWLITNPQTNLLGICGASPERFEFETKLKPEALQGALEALPRAFVRFDSSIFVKNYIRHQFGIGEKLIRNNFFVALKSLFLAVRSRDMKECILKEYPEFGDDYMKGFEGLTKPKISKVKKGEMEGVQGKPGYVVPACFEKVEGFTAALAGWIESRKLLRKPATGKAIQLLIDRLEQQPERAVEGLNAAIEQGWTTVKWDWLDNHSGKNGTKPVIKRLMVDEV